MASQSAKCKLHTWQRALWNRRRQRGPLPHYPVSISMTPAFFDPQHMLLRTQLNCLSRQTCKDFDVWLIDPHYEKRKDVVPELAARYKLDVKHVPYKPCLRIAKIYDCAIFNAAFCYSNSPLNMRYSCYRFVRPTWVERALHAPRGCNIDFYMLAVGPERSEGNVPEEQKRNLHKLIWNFESEEVRWDLIPTQSFYADDGCAEPVEGRNPLATWPAFMDRDSPSPQVAPLNIYGNIAWHRSQWLTLNGVNEVITNAAHWEDLDFDTRAANARQQVVRYAHLLYRLQHYYGHYSQRANAQVDHPLTSICTNCHRQVKANFGDRDYGEVLHDRIRSGQLTYYYRHRAWVCNECKLSGPIYDGLGLNHYCEHLRVWRVTQSPVLAQERIGRNLTTLVERMDRASSLQSKVALFNDSWDNPYYYA